MDSLGLRRKMFLKPVSRRMGYETNFNSSAHQLSIQPSVSLMIDGKYSQCVYNGLLIVQSNQKQQKAEKRQSTSDKNVQSNWRTIKSGQKTINKQELGIKNNFDFAFLHNLASNGVKQQHFLEEEDVLINQFESILAQNNANQNQSNSKLSKTNHKNIREQIQKILGKQQSEIIQKTLQKLLSKQILKDETKITIASQILSVCLSLIKQFHHDNLERLFGNPFIAINSINKSILQYIKSKYPRNKAVFAPMGLDKEFENINYLNFYPYDTLINAKFSFTSNSDGRVEILDKAKLFVNCILKEVDTHFESFNNLLTYKIFKLKDQKKVEQLGINQAPHQNNLNESSLKKIFQDLSKTHHIKISRKLPQNSQKYYEFGTDRMEIPSPQLFRVMLKWIDGMQQLIINPSNLIKGRIGLKYIKKSHGVMNDNKSSESIFFDQIQSRRFEDLKIDIIQKISEIKQKQYDAKIRELLDKLNQFNNNLVKTLTVRSPKFKFIKEQLAETLKFAKFNSLFLEWLIVQKFLVIIQTLSQLSTYFQTKIYKYLDFINFDVFDLMRACFSGKKEQIFQVFGNLKYLEGRGQIAIIRIKNRFQTPLNDVLINFKMSNSFIICELQLILVDVLQEGQQKLKYVQDLNHVIYQLERSPYGSMSQMAMIISHFDPTINYQAKINFNNDWFTDQVCKQSQGLNQQHQFIEIKTQTTPFVCSWCVKFYGRLDNFFQYYKCVKCNLQKCKACVFEENPTEQKRTYFRYFALCFLGLSNGLDQFSQLKDQGFIDNFFMRQESNFFSENYVKVRDFVNIEKGAKISSLEKLLHQSQKEYGLKATEPFYCLLLRFFNGNSELIAIKYQNYKIQNCSSKNEEENGEFGTKQFQKPTNFKLSKHDVLFFLKKKVYLNQRQSDGSYIGKFLLNQSKNLVLITNSQQKVHLQNKKQYKVICLIHKKEKYLLQIVKQQMKKSKGNQSAQQMQQLPSQLQQIHRVIDKTISKCITFKIQRLNFQLPNLGLIEQNLESFLLTPGKKQINKTNNQWTKQTQVLDLSQNKIKNPLSLMKIFCNIKQLYLAKNLIADTEFLKQTNSLKVLDLSQNKIKEIKEFINDSRMNKLMVLKLSHNIIEKYVKLNLPYLQQLYLSTNRIQEFLNLFESNLPALYILDISKNSMAGNSILDWRKFSKFPKLKKLEAIKINLSIEQTQTSKYLLTLEWLPKIEFLDFSHNKLQVLSTLSQKKLRQLKLISCSIKNINKIFTNKLINLQTLQLQGNQISEFPQKLELSQLRTLRLSGNKIKSLSNIRKSYLPKLQILEIQSNGIRDVNQLEYAQFNSLKQFSLDHNMIQEIPILKFQALEILNLDYNKLKDVGSLSKSNLPRLKFLLIKNNNLKSLPCLNFPQLLELSPINNQLVNIEQFAKSNLPKINKLTLYKNKLKQIHCQYNFENVTALILFENNLTNVDGLSTSKLDNLKMLSINSNKISSLPKLNLNNLQILNASRNHLTNVDVINEWSTPKLRVVDIHLNSIKHLNALKQLSIQVLDINNNELSDLTDFSLNSKLPMLRRFTASSNKKLNKIGGDFRGCPRLEQIVINHCALEHFNQLSKNADSFVNLKYLKKISFENNQITQLPPSDSLNHLENLEQLLVRFNKITQFDYKLSGLKSLKVLYLSSNLINQIKSQYFEDKCDISQVSFTRNTIRQLSLPETLQLKSLTLNFCQLTDKTLQHLQLPKLRQLFLKKNELQSVSFLTVPGAFTSLKKLYLQQNKIKIFPQFNLPEVSQIYLFQNPLIDVQQLITCVIPLIKFVYLRKIKSHNKNRNSKKQTNNLRAEKKQELNGDLDTQNIFRQMLQIQNNEMKPGKMNQSSSDEQTETINKSDGTQKEQEQSLLGAVLNQKSKQSSETQQQIMKVIEQFRQLNPNVYVKY